MHFKKDAFAWINFEWLEVSVCNMDLVTWVEIQWTDMSALLLRLQGWLLKVIHGVRPLFWVIAKIRASAILSHARTMPWQHKSYHWVYNYKEYLHVLLGHV